MILRAIDRRQNRLRWGRLLYGQLTGENGARTARPGVGIRPGVSISRTAVLGLGIVARIRARCEMQTRIGNETLSANYDNAAFSADHGSGLMIDHPSQPWNTDADLRWESYKRMRAGGSDDEGTGPTIHWTNTKNGDERMK